MMNIYIFINIYNTKFIEMKSDSADMFYTRGETYAKNGDFKKAIDDIKQYMKLNPYAFNAYMNLGYYYFEDGDYDNAILSFEKASVNDTKSWEPFFAASVMGYSKKMYEYAAKTLISAEFRNATTISTIEQLKSIEGDKWDYLKKRNSLLPEYFEKMKDIGHVTFY